MSEVKNCCCLVELSGIVGPTSSYATAGITFRSIWPHKPHHHNKLSGGCFLNLWWWNSNINFVFLNRHSLFLLYYNVHVHSIRFTELFTDKYMISLLKLVKFLCLSQNMISEPFHDECHACYYWCWPWLGAIQVWRLLQTAWPSAIHIKSLWYIYVPSDKHACCTLYWYIVVVYLE